MGKYVEAFRDLDLVIRFEPNNSEAYSRKAEVYTAIRQYHSALRAYDKAIQNAKEEDAFLYNNRASVLCNLGRYEDAIQDFTTALSIEWTYRVFANRGLAQNENGAHEAARWDGIAAMHLNPDGADAYFCIGLSEMGQGDYDAAIMSFDIAIDEAPDVFQYYLSRSRAKMMLQQYYPALEDCYKALELEPESIEADDLQRLLFDAVERNNPVMTNAIEMPMQQPINELKIQIDPLPYEGSTDTEEYLFEDPYGKGN